MSVRAGPGFDCVVEEVAVALASICVAAVRAGCPGAEEKHADAADAVEIAIGHGDIAGGSERSDGGAGVVRPGGVELNIGEVDALERAGALMTNRLPDEPAVAIKR